VLRLQSREGALRVLAKRVAFCERHPRDLVLAQKTTPGRFCAWSMSSSIAFTRAGTPAMRSCVLIDIIRRRRAPSAYSTSKSAFRSYGTIAHDLPRTETPREVAEHRCLELAHGSDRGRWRLEHRGRSIELEVRGPLVCTSLVALQRCAREGLGIVQLPAYVAREDLALGRLVHVLPSVTGARRAVFVVQPTRAYVAPRVRAFVERLVRELPSAMKSERTGARSSRR
jgi:DNA-binding transcriptional LysR family regulator